MSAPERVDVLVVGTGPGGSAAAYHLASHGVDVLAVDRARFPREKVCGDGLTPRGVAPLQRMGIDAGHPSFVRVDGLRVRGAGRELTLRWPQLESFPSFGVVRTRRDRDHALVRRATKGGAIHWEEAEAAAPVLDADGWVAGARIRRLDRDEEVTVRARLVIAADGASSRFAEKAGVSRAPGRPLGIAARRYFRSPRPQVPFLESWLDLWDGDELLPGYGWIFPLGDGMLNVGAGLLNTYTGFRRISAQRLFDVFVRMLPEAWGLSDDNAVGPLLSGPIPMGLNRRPLAQPGLMLVGDAAGAVNPFNGEGIAYAIETGELAAELAFESMAAGRPALAQMYPTMLKQRYGRYFRAGGAFSRAIGHPAVMRRLTRYGLPRERLMRFALKVMADLSDGEDGDAQDRLISGLVRMVPEG